MQAATSIEPLGVGGDTDMALLGHLWFSKESTTFSMNFNLKVSEALYNPNVSKSEFHSDMTLFYMGNSSMKILTRLFTKEDPHTPIISYVHHIVNVNFRTRKAIPWPSTMVEIFNKRRQSPFPQLELSARSEQLIRPAHTFVYNAYVVWSDTDFNQHLNFASYVKYANDALRAALRFRSDGKREVATNTSTATSEVNFSKSIKERFVLYQGDPSLALKGITKETVENGVKEMKVHFFRECRDNDLLQVHVWQDGVKNNVVFISIEKNNEISAQIVIEYLTTKSKL